jgi:hypothetical protein
LTFVFELEDNWVCRLLTWALNLDVWELRDAIVA